MTPVVTAMVDELALPIYCSHYDWDVDHPADLQHAKDLAAAAVRNHQEPARRFPCTGYLLEVNPDAIAGPRVLVCDVCLFETGVPRARPTSNPEQFTESSANQDIPF